MKSRVREVAEIRIEAMLEDARARDWTWGVAVDAVRVDSPDAPHPAVKDFFMMAIHPVQKDPPRGNRSGETWRATFEAPPGHYHLCISLSPADPSARTNRAFTTMQWLTETALTVEAGETRMVRQRVDLSSVELRPPIEREKIDAPTLASVFPRTTSAHDELASWIDRFYIGPFDGYPEEEIAACEARLGRALPVLFRDVMRFSGKHAWISAYMHPVRLDRIESQGDVLILLAEQQDSAFWGVSATEDSTDPPVLFSNGKRVEPEERSLSEFLKGVALMHRTATAPSLATPSTIDDAGLAHLATLERYRFFTHLDDDKGGGRYFIEGESVFHIHPGSAGGIRVMCGARTRAALLDAIQAAGMPAPRDIELEL